MIVHEVRLENIKSYGSPAVVVRLSRGVNAICGANGSGKSTILEAIGCALFQYLPYGHDQFVREGQSSGVITVLVESRFDGRTYEIVRRVGRNRPGHYVHDPEIHQTVAQGEADVRRWLHQHLQIPDEVDLPALFVDAVGPLQGTLTAPFLEGRAERKSKFNRLLRVQEYEEAWTKLRNLDSALGAEESALNERIAYLNGQTVGKGSLELQRAAKIDEQAALGLQLSRFLAEHDLLDRRLAAFQEGERAWREATSQLNLAAERASHASERLTRARTDWETSRDAAATLARVADERDAYLRCETDLRIVEDERRKRDALRTDEARLVQERTKAQADLDRAEAEVEVARQAKIDAVEQERRIPQQAAAEARVRELLAAKQEALEIQKRFQTTYERGCRTKEMKDRAEAELSNALERRELAEDLPRRRSVLEECVRELQAATRADGRQAEIRNQINDATKREAALRSRLAELDRTLIGLRTEPDPTTSSLELQQRLTDVSGQLVVARSSLEHAQTTRGQVAGGLCPLLHEPCQNLRPGVTLERHFDEEIERWSREVALASERVSLADRAVQSARAAEQRQARAAEAERERGQIDRDLHDEEARLAEARDLLREVAVLATSLTTRREAEGRARQDVAEAEAARGVVERIPDLVRQVDELGRDLEGYRADYQRDRARLDELKGVDADLVTAQEVLAALGAPREAAARLRAEAAQLPDRQTRRERLIQTLSQIQEALTEVTSRLAPFTDLDERARALRIRRDACRPAYETSLAVAPIAGLLPERQTQLAAAETEAARAIEVREQAQEKLLQASLAYDGAEHQRTDARRHELGQVIGNTRARMGAAEEETAQIDDKLAAIAKLDREQADLTAERERIGEEKQVAAALRNAIRAAGPEITRQLLSRISRTASRINGEILNQSGVDLEWTPEYEIVTHRQGEQRGFAQLSGGEQMAAALAVRLAVLRDLSNIRIAFLDEPTAHLDQERRTNLGDQVQRLQGFDQLVVISHDDTFDGLFGHVVRVGRQSGASQVLETT